MSGVFGGSKAPTYDPRKARKSQLETARLSQFGVDSPLGTVQTVKDPTTGQLTRQYGLSEADQQRQSLISSGLSGLSLDPTRAEDAYYQRATRQLMPQFEQSQEDLQQSLANRGIQPGSELYDREMSRLQSTQQGTLADISSQAVSSGQQLLGSQIGNIGALAGQRDVLGIQGMGGSTGVTDTYEKQLASQQQQAQARQQGLSSALGAGVGLAMMSDKRLKENLEVVGELDNGLKVYMGNYKEETGLDTRPQLFLIAQEVLEVNPEAVVEEDGFYKVNYKEAVK